MILGTVEWKNDTVLTTSIYFIIVASVRDNQLNFKCLSSIQRSVKSLIYKGTVWRDLRICDSEVLPISLCARSKDLLRELERLRHPRT